MDWFKTPTRYYHDAALLRAGEAAEILYLRGKGYCAGEENDGFVPAEALNLIVSTRGRARAAALVRVGLWAVAPGGWTYVAWDQITADELATKREDARTRQARRRNRLKTASSRESRVTHADSHSDVSSTEVEEEVEAAAAAARDGLDPTRPGAGGPALPVAVEILATRLRANTALAGLRFDQLTDDQVLELDDLVQAHGDDRLIDVAIATLRHPAPVSVAAFLGSWRAMPPPGRPVSLVRPLCSTHGLQMHGGVCRSCEADRKAGDQ